ncbi:MAG: pirin family protein [bacterium]|nr:pirin family protein [bacterium]
MLTVRKSEDRGLTDWGWLKSQHTFSFGEYMDAKHHQFHALRVINEDRVAPAKGFGEHPHRDMEILSYVLSGALEHKDSMGTGSVVRAGDVQRMSAGTGVTHSEFNPSPSEPTHFLQIWLFPERRGLEPEYEQSAFSDELLGNNLVPIASPDGRDGSLTIHQDAVIYASVQEAGRRIEPPLEAKRSGWLQIISGEARIRDIVLSAGDGLAIENEHGLALDAVQTTKFLFFDLA